MLKAFDAQMNDWNLIVSAPAYDNLMLKAALTDLVTIFNKHLSQTISEQIIRSTILKTTDPFVKEINQAFKVTNAVSLHLSYRVFIWKKRLFLSLIEYKY